MRDGRLPATPVVSIVIPVFNKLAFTRQCLDRIARHTPVPHEVIVVDNGSQDGTEAELCRRAAEEPRLRYHRNAANLGFAKANNIGARLATGTYLCLLNNDTLVEPGWLEAMVACAGADARIGVVGLKQLFPYTNRIHHTGIIFTAGGVPQHIYPHADASLSHVNKQREYQAVTGACLLISRTLYLELGGLDERYLNGYEDIDLCLAVRERGLKVVCCTDAYIYHYGQITEGRTADDDANAGLFRNKWGARLRVDEAEYFRSDLADLRAAERSVAGPRARPPGPRPWYFVDDLSQPSALVWAVADLALALRRLGAPVHVTSSAITDTLPPAARRELEKLRAATADPEGVQLRWSHYWPQHLFRELTGVVNLEFFVINYLFGQPGRDPWDYWLQCLAQNHVHKLPLTGFCQDVLRQVGVPAGASDVIPLGYSPEVHQVDPPRRRPDRFRFLTVTNSHDLERYGTRLLLETYWATFGPADDVLLVVKDYGAASGDTTLRRLIRGAAGRAPVEYAAEFTSKHKLIELYRSCDAFVSAHRGEGFGMKILDAMACGLPVIIPLFGGPTEFCTADNCLPVAHALAAMGDCLDTRALPIGNQPMWAEPSREDLARQLRRVHADPAAARRIGDRGREDVITRFTWEAAAQRLVEVVARLEAARPGSAAAPAPAVVEPAAKAAETSPYWLGCRLSVVIPTYNRQTILAECLRALERQTILPQEFEVVVVDDGSTDGTTDVVTGRAFPFAVRYHRQPNQGPGAARNLAITLSRGELVLFIGDDILADPRLLEEHLRAHARHPEPGAAILGHIDWPPWLARTEVMDFVCGKDTRQFAYQYIPHLPVLDYRFFYTSNISLKRRFLVEAQDAGIRFDPCFRYAAFEDSEFAYRLQPRGLTIHYAPEARVCHDHFMDLESFAAREGKVGEMAVVFYRKHPGLDEVLQVRWIADWVEPVERVVADPEQLAALEAFDRASDDRLRSLARVLESRLSDADAPPDERDDLRSLLHEVLRAIFDVERLRGKVREWFQGVTEPRKINAAQALLAAGAKLAVLTTHDARFRRHVPVEDLLAGQAAKRLEAEIGRHAPRGNGHGPLAGRVPARAATAAASTFRASRLFALLRQADLAAQRRLAGTLGPHWLARYQRLRTGLKRRLP